MCNYVYQCKDHVGNIWLSYSDVNHNNSSPVSLQIKEENNYYPFGLQHKGYNNVTAGRDHKYGYNAKEEQEELGLDWLDITARNYDPALGRWMNIDPLAEQMPEWSPYNYAFDNPIKFHDPDGRAPSGGCPPGDPDCGQNENNSTEPIEKAVEVTAKAVKEKTIEAVLYAARTSSSNCY